jgi:hypothetical protein
VVRAVALALVFTFGISVEIVCAVVFICRLVRPVAEFRIIEGNVAMCDVVMRASSETGVAMAMGHRLSCLENV